MEFLYDVLSTTKQLLTYSRARTYSFARGVNHTLLFITDIS